MVRRGETGDISIMAEIYCQDIKETYKSILPKDYLVQCYHLYMWQKTPKEEELGRD